MKITVSFDEENLRDYEKRGSSLSFTIYLTHDGVSYPEEGWVDFGAVILDYWTVSLCLLAEGKVGQGLVFMDGPFELNAISIPSTDSVELRADEENLIWVLPFEELADEVIIASKKVLDIFNRLSVGKKNISSLSAGIARLENLLRVRQQRSHI